MPREQLIGSDFSDYFTEPERRGGDTSRCSHEGSVQDYPLAIRHASGKVTDVLYNATVFRDERAKCDGVFAAARDITERKRAEEATVQGFALRPQPDRGQPGPAGHHQPRGQDHRRQRATETVTGVSRERLIGSDFSDYFTEPEKARQGLRAGVRRRDRCGIIRWPSATRPGRVTDVLYNASVFKNEAGEIEGVFAAARDITERKRAEERLRQASLYARSLHRSQPGPAGDDQPGGQDHRCEPGHRDGDGGFAASA